MRCRQPQTEETKQKIRAAMLRIGHKPPSQLGRKRSIETRELIRKSKIGHRHTEETRSKMSISRTGIGNHFYGKIHSESTLSIMSAKKIGRKPSNWILDRSLIKRQEERGGTLHKQWSKDVKNRDKWTCREKNDDCIGKVVAHHIYPWAIYPELRYEINNGITLCQSHHPRRRGDEIKLIPHFSNLVLGTV